MPRKIMRMPLMRAKSSRFPEKNRPKAEKPSPREKKAKLTPSTKQKVLIITLPRG